MEASLATSGGSQALIWTFDVMIAWQTVFIDALWVLGLAGALATLSYISWYRSVVHWSWARAFSAPRALTPLTVSMELFSIGMAMNGLVAYRPAPWWETAAWSILAILFAVQTVIYGMAGMRYGWNTPLEGRKHERT